MANNGKKANSKSEPEALKSLLKNLNELGFGVGSGKKADQKNMSEIISHLMSIVILLSKEVSELKSEIKEANPTTPEVRHLEDELDESCQRSRKGNIILSCPKPEPGSIPLIKSDDKLKEEKTTLTEHILDLIQKKYKVDIPESDIQALHRLPNNSVLLKLWNRKEKSAWANLKSAIRKGGDKQLQVFGNFQMTARRSGIIFELRQLKKSNKIFKFSSDENGTIWYQKTDKDKSTRITTYMMNGIIFPTITKEELLKQIE